MKETKNENLNHGKPELVIVTGGICNGKTTHIKANYSEGYSNTDASEIFLHLSQGEYYDFPSHLEAEMNEIGVNKMKDSINNRDNMVIELVGADSESLNELINLAVEIGYKTSLDYIECDEEVALMRNLNREDDNISSYYCEPYHLMWFKQAATDYLNQ